MSLNAEFPMPTEIVADESTMTDSYAKFTAEPFQHGFGLTIGNALRRVLLSSLEGAAIKSVTIEGVKHEFDKKSNVLEDITEVVVNLKKIKLILACDGPKTYEIRCDKRGMVTAADIVTDGFLTVVNPEQVICELTKVDKNNPGFHAKIEVDTGRGYLPTESIETSREIGQIPVDCIFSPVTRVNFHVGSARVGEATDMDSLEIEIWTDGRITPRTALENATKILIEHLQPFLGAQTGTAGSVILLSKEDQALYAKLSQSIETLDLSNRAMNCLKGANIRTLGGICVRTSKQLLQCRNFGDKTLDEINEQIVKKGLSLGMEMSKDLHSVIIRDNQMDEEENK